VTKALDGRRASVSVLPSMRSTRRATNLIDRLARQRGLEHDRGRNVEVEVNASARVEDDPRFIGGVEDGMVS